jgi:hypothetical protein
MKGIEAKRAVTSTLERVWQASGHRPADLTILFAGKQAMISYQTVRNRLTVKINMPAVDEASDVDMRLFNNLIAFSLDEMAFAWFGSEGVLARMKEEREDDVASIYAYAAALEDVRVERKLIEAEYAGNARSLLESLLNTMLSNQKPLDNTVKGNVPAMLSIEGKRANGYAIVTPDTLEGCKWAEPMRKALLALTAATSTETVVMIAKMLHKDIGNIDQDDEGEGEGEGEPKEGEGGGEGEGDSSGEGEGKPDKQSKDSPVGDTPSKGSGEGSKELINLNYKDTLETEMRRSYKNPEVSRLPARTKPNVHKFTFE